MKNVLKPLDVFRGKSSDHGGGMERICKLITTMLASTWLWPIAIPQRLPSLNFKAAEFADQGYAVTDIDMLSGAQRFRNLRFDDDGRIFGIEPSQITPELRAVLSIEGAPGFPQLNAHMLNSALQRGAIAPLWEVKTAKMQGAAGDPNAGLTEEERAAKAGLGAALDSAYAQSHPNDANAKNKRAGHFMPIGIDLDRSGSVSTLSIAQTEASNTAVTFDWDGLGYQKQTGWIASNDGFLVLDRDANQYICGLVAAEANVLRVNCYKKDSNLRNIYEGCRPRSFSKPTLDAANGACWRDVA